MLPHECFVQPQFGSVRLSLSVHRRRRAMKKYIAAAVLAAVAIPSAPAVADPPPWAPAHGKRAKDRGLYDGSGRYSEPRRLSPNDRILRAKDGRYYCRRDTGPNGLTIGAPGCIF